MSGAPAGLRRRADEAVAAFCALLREESRERRRGGLRRDDLRRYLGPLFDPRGELNPLGVAGYAARLRPVVEFLLQAPPGLKILDAGCGYGTESLLFAWLGADVTGVELVGERAALAAGRPAFFAAAGLDGRRVRFRNANVLRFLQSGESFDLIWALEAVSHIYPPEAFLLQARRRLRPGGVLALSDPNQANPLAWLRAVLIRGSLRHEPHQEFNDPESGAPVDYGQEKIYTVFRMARLLKTAGFAVERVSSAGFLATTWTSGSRRPPLGPAALLTFQETVRRIPVLRRMGSNYTILARPRELPGSRTP